MGLSAGQARLLCITARKSNCEYQSMQMSHQKLAISRNLEAISNEYQNSLEQTKLIYDYYGTGTTNTPLSYGILMNPSELNNYYPNLLTNSSGQVVLDSKYAAAARAAGIPQEGLNGIPSDTVRNNFVNALAENEIITETRAAKFKNTTYNQLAGIGAISSAAITTKEVSYDELVQMLSSTDYKANAIYSSFSNDLVRNFNIYEAKSDNTCTYRNYDGAEIVTLGDLLNGSKDFILAAEGKPNNNNLTVYQGIVDALCNSEVWDTMFNTIETLLDTGDSYAQEALAYARDEIEGYITNLGAGCTDSTVGTDDSTYESEGKNIRSNFGKWITLKDDDDSVVREKGTSADAINAIGLCGIYNHDNDGKKDDDNCMSMATINLSSMMRAYLTFFAKKMEGLSSSSYSVGSTKTTSNFVNNPFKFQICTGTTMSEDDLTLVNSYDTILNQLCINGWVENDKVNDNQYLQEMFQNGMMFMSKINDDGYYYQNNYKTNTYIKTVEDESAIAQAEAKYTTEKQKLTSKENTLDMKMKNLDTEISSLSTEYETVKSTITKNIARTFKRYNA